eukprot:TRINITY_DN14636_c0_g1_i1.p1 TRINITY_DN14636_c0_g1~~TRINITY_DN14636_c0_g1_i1.p1  ORF type:complete len:344 (+),score=72.01 TRINITY_DN14636_c0_g1_i1:134-1165(+)
MLTDVEEKGNVTIESDHTDSTYGVGWTLVALYLFLVLLSMISLVFDAWRWKDNSGGSSSSASSSSSSPTSSPKSIKRSFVLFHVLMLLFGIARTWQVIVILKARNVAVSLGMVFPLNLFAILLFISAFSCIVFNGSKAAFRLRKSIKVWHWLLFGMNVLLWVFTIVVVIAFYAGFSFDSERGTFGDPEEALDFDRPYHLLYDATLAIITFCQVFLAIACIVILAATVHIILRSAEQTKRKRRIMRIVKLSLAYGILAVFFLVRTIVVWRTVITHRHLHDTPFLVVELLVPDIVPSFLLFFIEYLAIKRRLFSSSADKTSAAGSSTTGGGQSSKMYSNSGVASA